MNPLLLLSKGRNEKQARDESMLWEAGRGLGMTRKGSLSTVPSDRGFYTEPADSLSLKDQVKLVTAA